MADFFIDTLIKGAEVRFHNLKHMEWREEVNLTYDTLITGVRPRVSTSGARSIEIESESNRGRILFSGPFRRLQRKAQVFPLEDIIPVRSRLTHSLEVAHIGKYISQVIIRNLREQNKLGEVGLSPDREIAFVNLVETACLMHDIGNPPYGHFGEYAIRDWFRNNGPDAYKKAIKDHDKEMEAFEKREYQDFLRFDGNAQGFRTVTRLQGLDGTTGYNLTYSQLATYLKYVVPPYLVDPDHPFKKKPGFFSTEMDVVTDMRKHLGLEDGKRFPLAYIMEAADDIAYCISDIEDGLDKGVIDADQFKARIKETWNELVDPSADYRNYLPETIDTCWVAKDSQAVEPLVRFKTTVINDLVQLVGRRYVDEHERYLKGDAESLIREDTKEFLVLGSLKRVVIRELYSSRAAQDIELSGHSVVQGLLKYFSRLLECPRFDFEAVMRNQAEGPHIGSTDLERRLFKLLTNKHIIAYKKAVAGDINNFEEWYHRAHLVVDYISSMTDNYALRTYQLLSGIRIEQQS